MIRAIFSIVMAISLASYSSHKLSRHLAVPGTDVIDAVSMLEPIEEPPEPVHARPPEPVVAVPVQGDPVVASGLPSEEAAQTTGTPPRGAANPTGNSRQVIVDNSVGDYIQEWINKDRIVLAWLASSPSPSAPAVIWQTSAGTQTGDREAASRLRSDRNSVLILLEHNSPVDLKLREILAVPPSADGSVLIALRSAVTNGENTGTLRLTAGSDHEPRLSPPASNGLAGLARANSAE